MAGDNHAPDGWHTVTPRIFCNDPRGLFDFLQQVFDAGGEYEAERPTVAVLGDSMIMISSTEARAHTPAFLYVYVADADAVYRRAVEAGAHVLEAPVDMPYGDRRCMFEDTWGNTWQVANT